MKFRKQTGKDIQKKRKFSNGVGVSTATIGNEINLGSVSI